MVPRPGRTRPVTFRFVSVAATTAAASLLFAGCSGAGSGRAARLSAAGSGADTARPVVPPTIRYAAGPTARCAPTPAAQTATTAPAVTFVTSHDGFAAGRSGLYATHNGGATWTLRYSGSVDAIDFPDRASGWIVTPAGLLRTADGGRCWHALPPPPRQLASVSF